MKCACALFSPVVCSDKQYVSILSHKQHDLRKKKIDHKICVLNFFTNFVENISHSKQEMSAI